MTKDQVKKLCDEIAPKFGFDPKLILAICEQESGFEPTARRMENGFFRKYIEKRDYNELDELLLSCSYGLMQVMGMSLVEMKLIDINEIYQELYNFLMKPHLQIGYGCQWLQVKQKQCKNPDDTTEMLQRYNGGGNQFYANEVISRIGR